MHASLIQPQTPIAHDPGPDARTDRRCLLLADGDADVHAIYGAVLEREGFRVLHAFSAAECLRLAGTPRMCAALVSVGGCGLLTWRALHELAAAAAGGFAIVCLTTDPRLSPAARRLPRGAAAVVMLPCTPEELAAEVCRVVLPGPGRPN